MQVTGVRVHQRPAGTDIPRPRNGHGSAFDKVADIVCAAPIIARKADIASAVEGFRQRGLGILVEIHFGQAEFGQHGRRQIGNVAHGARVKTVFLHFGCGRLDVAHGIIFCAEGMSHFDDLRQVVDVALHGNKCHADLRFGEMPAAAHFEKAAQVFKYQRKFRSQAHITKAFGGGSVQRNPEHIESGVDQFAGFFLGQDRAVGDEFNFHAQAL